jgi:hypothetical protein
MTPPETAAVQLEAKKVNAAPTQTRVDQARIDKWIRDRLVAAWPGGCWQCRRPFAPGQKFIDVRGDDVTVRFHQSCHAGWLAQQETLARKAMGLERTTKETTAP